MITTEAKRAPSSPESKGELASLQLPADVAVKVKLAQLISEYHNVLKGLEPPSAAGSLRETTPKEKEAFLKAVRGALHLPEDAQVEVTRTHSTTVIEWSAGDKTMRYTRDTNTDGISKSTLEHQKKMEEPRAPQP